MLSTLLIMLILFIDIGFNYQLNEENIFFDRVKHFSIIQKFVDH